MTLPLATGKTVTNSIEISKTVVLSYLLIIMNKIELENGALSDM